jgi:hypothetical protein
LDSEIIDEGLMRRISTSIKESVVLDSSVRGSLGEDPFLSETDGPLSQNFLGVTGGNQWYCSMALLIAFSLERKALLQVLLAPVHLVEADGHTL